MTTTADTAAGVVYVRHNGQPLDRTLTPVLELGRVGDLTEGPSPEEFGRIARVMADGAGRIYVSDQIPPEVRVFGPDGTYIRTVGRDGAGPGELGGLYGTEWLAPDTFLVVDPGNARLAALTTDGEQIRQWGWLRYSGAARLFLFTAGRGEAVVRTLIPGRQEGAPVRDAWLRVTLHGPPDTLDVPTPESLGLDLPTNLEICRGDGIGFFNNDYGPSFIGVPAPDLERAVAVNTAYRISFLDPNGDTVRVITRDVDPVPLPDTARNGVEERYRAFQVDWRSADCEGGIAHPDFLPVLRDLFFDYGGRMLVEYNRADGPAFDVFDRHGRFVATFAVPDRDPSVPPYLRGDRLYIVTKDSLDVQRVEVYRLLESGG